MSWYGVMKYMFNKDNAYKLLKFIVVEFLFLLITTLLSGGSQDLVVPLLFSGFTLVFILQIWGK